MLKTGGIKGHKKSPQMATWLLLLSWFVSAVSGTIMNKAVMKIFKYPIAFTSLHLLVGSILDWIIVRQKKGNSFRFNWSHFTACRWNGIWFAFSKYFTYLSYAAIPLSLAHTVKSSGPVFSVMVHIIWMRECVPLSEMASLIPITIGVTLSAVNEIDFEIVGFLAALVATLLGVFQNVTSKGVLTKYHHSISPMELHMYGSMLALIFLIPFAIIKEGSDIYSQFITPHLIIASDATADVKSSHFPIMGIVLSCVALYGQTMASLYLLKRVTTVAHQVANTSKRFCIIVCSVMYFRNVITLMNGVGIIMAIAGFFTYQRIHKRNNRRRLAQHNAKQRLLNASTARYTAIPTAAQTIELSNIVNSAVHKKIDDDSDGAAAERQINLEMSSKLLKNGRITNATPQRILNTAAINAAQEMSHRRESSFDGIKSPNLSTFSLP